MPHSVKRGDSKTLRWNLGRDLTGVTTARVIIAEKVGSAPVLDRAGTIDSPATAGIVSLALTADDYGAGKLEIPTGATRSVYLVEIQTEPGPLTHPDSHEAPHEKLILLRDLG